MKTLKTLFFSLILLLSFSTGLSAEYFKDIIISGPNGVWIDPRAYTSLSSAITAAGASERTIVISSPLTTTNLTIPTNITLEFLRDGMITDTGILTLNTKKIIAPSRQIFGNNQIAFAAGSVVRSSWFSSTQLAIFWTSTDTLTLIIDKADTLTGVVTVGNNVTLEWQGPGNILTADAGASISNIGQVQAGNYQLFAGAGDFSFRDGTNLNLSWFSHLRSAITWIDTNTVTLVVPSTSVVDFDDTVPSNIILDLSNQSGLLSISPGITLTIHSSMKIIAPINKQIFTGTGAVAFSAGGILPAAWFEPFTQAGITKALTSIGGLQYTLLLCPGTWVISTNADWSTYSNISFSIPTGALFQIATGTLTTIGGSLEAGLYQIFNCVGTGAIKFSGGKVKTIYPQWFGAVGNNVTDDTAAFQKTFDSVSTEGQTVHIPTAAVKYYITASIVVTPKRLIVSGDGHGSWLRTDQNITILDFSPTVPFIGGLVIQNIQLEGNSTGATQNGLRLHHVTKAWKIDGVKCTGFGGVGMLIEDSRYGRILDPFIDNSEIGIYLYSNAEDVTSILIEGGTIGQSGKENGIGIRADRVEDLVIRKVALEYNNKVGTAKTGIMLYGGFNISISHIYGGNEDYIIKTAIHPTTLLAVRGLHIYDCFFGAFDTDVSLIYLNGDTSTLIDGVGYWGVKPVVAFITLTAQSSNAILDLQGIYAGGVVLANAALSTSAYSYLVVDNGVNTIWRTSAAQKIWSYRADILADDAHVVVPTSNYGGWGVAKLGNDEEYAFFVFGPTAVVSIISGSANAVTTDTDGKFCILDGGSNVHIKNRLGSSKHIQIQINSY